MQPFIIFLHLLDKINIKIIMKRILATLIIAVLLIPAVKASHVIGGDFQINMTSYDSINGVGTYHVKLRVYRDDINGIALPAQVAFNVFQMNTHTPVFVTNQNLPVTSQGLVTLGDPCYTPDPNVVSIEEGIYELSGVQIPDYGPGYYVSASINARNALAINVPTGGTMTWLALIPDPAIGLNSTPDFGNYPPDAYFCTSGPKQFSYPITDADGDSLSYDLVEPLSSSSTTAGPGAGAYPFYPSLGWQVGYSLANIVGGAPPMSINQATGVITAAPTVQGFFTFAIKVEEWRDTTAAQNGPKVKIGEVRRDVQYISLNCTSGSPPQFLNTVPTMGQTLQIDYNREWCKDLIFNDINATDTLYIEMISPVFDSGAYQTFPPIVAGNQTFYYDETFYGSGIWQDSVVIPPSQTDTVGEYNIGTVATRFCWTPGCDEVGGVFPFQVNAFSLGCDGKSQDSILFNIEVVPPPAVLGNPGIIDVTYGNAQCVNIVFEDSNIVDLMDINITSPVFDFPNSTAEFPDLPNNYEYVSYTQAPVITGVPNDDPNHFVVATQVCWEPDCEHIGTTYDFRATLHSVDCPTAINDTIDFGLAINPPFDSLDVVPNVITPNGDGMNDVYTLGYTDENGVRHGGTSNPCEDFIKVEIFNRWGIRVFDSEDPEFAWDGKNNSGARVPDGTYFVLVSGKYGNEEVKLEQRVVTVMGAK